MTTKTIFVLLLTAISIAVVVSTPLRLGLDLRGGSSFVLQIGSPGEQLQPGVLEETRRVVERKINAYGLEEATVQPYGARNDRLLVQLPGSTAEVARVRASLERQGVLEWFPVLEGPFSDQSQAYSLRGGVLRPGERLYSTGDTGEKNRWYLVQGTAIVRGADLKNARAVSERTGGWATAFTLSNDAGERFARFTEANLGKRMAIVLDGKILSVGEIQDRIQSEGQIRGSRSAADAEDLAILLRAGALPAALRIVEEMQVAPSLGADSIRQSIAAGLAGVAGIVAILLAYYRRPGINATVVLVLNGLLLIAVLLLCDAVLTLPGIAGLILTAGMAVDSNVLIFERIREMRQGRSEWGAIQAGFDRAWATILDTHVTTIVSCLFLFWLGTVAVKGFAVTLAIGLLTNVFTAVFVSRLLFEWETRRRKVPA